MGTKTKATPMLDVAEKPGFVGTKGRSRKSEEHAGPTFGQIRKGDVLRGVWRVLEVSGPGQQSPYEGVMFIKAIRGEGDDAVRMVFQGKASKPFYGKVERNGKR